MRTRMIWFGIVAVLVTVVVVAFGMSMSNGQSDQHEFNAATTTSSCGPVHTTCSEQSAPSSYKFSKQCRHYIRQHLHDKYGVPVNYCTVDFVPPAPRPGGYEALPGTPMPVDTTCNMSGCYLNMDGVLKQYK